MTRLSPLEEVLFQGWTKVHGVDNHDDPNNQFDHRGLYKQTNGMVMPGHVVRQMAQDHNKAMEPQDQGGSMEFPDPYAAQAEMHGNMIKAQTDMKREAMKGQLEQQKHGNKLEIEKMKLMHKSAEADKDRQVQAAQAEQARVQAEKDAQQQRQFQMQDSLMQRQHQVEDTHMQRQQQVEDSQRAEQSGLHQTLMKEHLSRSRPEPQQSMGGGPMQAQGQPPQGITPTSDPGPQSEPPQTSGLAQQLMARQGG